MRTPRGYSVIHPGDLVQIDTLDVRPPPNVMFKQFTARDILSRRDVIEVRGTATARTAAELLGTVQRRMPFPLKAVQVDGRAECPRGEGQQNPDRGVL